MELYCFFEALSIRTSSCGRSSRTLILLGRQELLETGSAVISPSSPTQTICPRTLRTSTQWNSFCGSIEEQSLCYSLPKSGIS